MNSQINHQAPPAGKKAPKYTLVIEGKEYDWDHDTITATDIARLGGWDLSQGVIEIDKDNNERAVAVDEVIEVKPGQGFGKKHRWKRG
ncbi:MAG: hypothetical protein QM760_16085 [Nibricoccus sp.]